MKLACKADHYRQLVTETKMKYHEICSLPERNSVTTPKKAKLKYLQKNHSVFISANYMSNNIPYWGSAQPG